MKHLKLLIGTLIVLITASAIFSCNDNQRSEEQLKAELSAVKKELSDIKSQLNSAPDTVVVVKSALPLSDTVNHVKEKKNIQTPAPKPAKEEEVRKTKEQPRQPSPTKEEEEVLYYYSNSNHLSLRITPWVDGRRKLIFYDPFGNVQYTQEDVRMSYIEVSEVKEFHSNGAVAKIHIHNNPGASMYWSESDVTFGINNEPEWMVVQTYPIESLSDTQNNHYYYDKKSGLWKKQLVQE